MRYINLLISEEKLTLEECFKHHPKGHVRMRGHALLLSHEGKSVPYIADLYKVERRTIDSWFNRWQTHGIAGLFILPGRGLKSVFANVDPIDVMLIKSEIYLNPQKCGKVAESLSEKMNLKISEKQLKDFLKKNSSIAGNECENA
jgi:transposase